jgi:hypothetical protein
MCKHLYYKEWSLEVREIERSAKGIEHLFLEEIVFESKSQHYLMQELQCLEHKKIWCLTSS